MKAFQRYLRPILAHRLSDSVTNAPQVERRSIINLFVRSLPLLALGFGAVGQTITASTLPAAESAPASESQGDKKLKQATFGGGCFWCTEAVFQRLKGVEQVVSGYSGGHVVNPTYEQVCGKKTGHVEVIQITYDPSVVSYEKLLIVFFKTHDPTTKNRQGADSGPQYRSVVFYQDDEQKKIAEDVRKKLNDKIFNGKIVTDIDPLINFYPAEDYHQNYFNENPGNPYCQGVVASKVRKFIELFGDDAKD